AQYCPERWPTRPPPAQLTPRKGGHTRHNRPEKHHEVAILRKWLDDHEAAKRHRIERGVLARPPARQKEQAAVTCRGKHCPGRFNDPRIEIRQPKFGIMRVWKFRIIERYQVSHHHAVKRLTWKADDARFSGSRCHAEFLRRPLSQ